MEPGLSSLRPSPRRGRRRSGDCLVSFGAQYRGFALLVTPRCAFQSPVSRRYYVKHGRYCHKPAECFVQRTYAGQYAEDRIDAMLMYNANIIGQATRNANHRFMVLLRHVCNANRYLAVILWLSIRPSPVITSANRECVPQIQRRSDDFNTTFQFPAPKKRHHRITTPPAALRRGHLHINMQRFNDIGIVRGYCPAQQSSLHWLPSWAKDARCAVIAHQRDW